MAIQSRPPVITIMGHVDHGKTTLLDYIRKAKVAAGEAGGITQHIGAYQTEFKGKKLTFIDTPGHAAFNKMRERGAKVTDIVVLVVAANDGVKPQTIESIRHIQEAKVPVVVAINMSDLPNTYPDVVKGELAEHGILTVGFGGDVEAIAISAKTGKGVDTLLETLAVTADLNEYTADPDATLKAVVIESSKDAQRGSVATVIVQQGSLRVRQDIATETASGRVRMLNDENRRPIQVATPGTPAEVVGLKEVPRVGETVWDIHAVQPAADEVTDSAEKHNASTPSQSMAAAELGLGDNAAIGSDILDLFEERQKLKLIIRSDVTGTLEAITQTIDQDSVALISAAVGPVSEQDIDLAETTGSVIIAFNVRVSGKIKQLAKEAGVRIKSYDIIYHLLEDLQKQMLKFLEPTIDEAVVGEAEILQIFEMRGERIAGVRVKTGEIKKSDLLHLKRDDEIVANPVIKTMLHGKEEISAVRAKNEAGLTFKNRKLDFRIGDILVAYKIEVDVE